MQIAQTDDDNLQLRATNYEIPAPFATAAAGKIEIKIFNWWGGGAGKREKEHAIKNQLLW